VVDVYYFLLLTKQITSILVVVTHYYADLRMTQLPKTMTVPEAGAAYFDLSRGASYEAAKRGEIPTIKIGKLLRVPVRAMEEMLAAASSTKDVA